MKRIFVCPKKIFTLPSNIFAYPKQIFTLPRNIFARCEDDLHKSQADLHTSQQYLHLLRRWCSYILCRSSLFTKILMGSWPKMIFTLGEVNTSYRRKSSLGEDVMLSSGIFAFRVYRRIRYCRADPVSNLIWFGTCWHEVIIWLVSTLLIVSIFSLTWKISVEINCFLLWH